MSRSFRDVLKFSVPTFLCAAMLSGCGSGSSGSADLNQGGSVQQPPPPVTVTETFDFRSETDWFVSGTPPTHARFSGGTATDVGAGAWIIKAGETGVVDFGTPADTVKFSTADDFDPTASAGTGAQKTGTSVGAARKMDPPFDVPMFVRGTINDSWANPPPASNKMEEIEDNVLALVMAVEPGDYKFKIADKDWGPTTNCGFKNAPGSVTLGVPLPLNCAAISGGNISITIPKAADYLFLLDVIDQGNPTVTVAEFTDDGGGGGGEEPEDSTEIRIYAVDTLTAGAQPALYATVKGKGSINIDEIVDRTGGSPRVTRIEIENLGTAGDIGIADFAWTANAQFAPAAGTVDIFYTLPSGSAAGTTIVVGGKTYSCAAPPAGSPYSCVARGVEVTPFANTTMAVKNPDGSTRDTIIFNGGSGAEDVFAYSGSKYATTGAEPVAPPAVLDAAAHWVSAGTLVYSPPAGTAKVELLYSPNASIASGPAGFTGTFQTITLTSTTNPKPPFNSQLHTLPAWSLGAAAANAKDLARGQLVAVARGATGVVLDATYVQTSGAIDDLYAAAAYDETLGVSYSSGVPSLAVWAPTALKTPGVSVNVYDAAGKKLETKPMTLDEASGIWRVTGTAAWDRKFYTISLNVYSPHYASNAIVANEVTDPYSVSLATDSVRSQFVNLDDADLKPEGWDTLAKPALEAPEDIVIYELHVRDFSIADSSVPADHRGKFTAFDVPGTAGRNHLQQLAQAGLTHVHILPAFDIATVKEDPDDRVDINDPVEDLCAANAAAANLCVTDAGKTIRKAMEDAVAAGRIDLPQQIVGWMRAVDGFNWGYDPLHFGAPEGSYSTDPNGEARIRDFRRMVKGLNELGLRTVMDVVYNHTNASAQNPKSVLDRVVPGYYHRRDNTSGGVLRDTCCDDTASEFQMMEKLMIDTGKTWVEQYKVSGFRFDLSGFHTLDNLLDFQAAVKAIDPSTYVYGEAWNFGAVGNDARFTQATQRNLGGTGIGSFSDRIRDPLRGGGPFDSGDAYVKNQGFINGWFYDPNAANTGSVADRQELIKATDNIRVWLAGGLEDYRLQNAAGATVTGAAIDYNGQPSGYTEDPSEGINYGEKHDNQTMWDLSAYKHPDATSLADRVRAHNVGQSLVLLGQAIPFMHAGSEILRSKSGDRDSYDSGDWFNELDWTLAGTKWAQGLPVADKNEGEWPILESKYQAVPRPDAAAQQRALDHVREMLQIRKSSVLFRLRDAAQVESRVRFLNTGPSQVPGVVAMSIDGCTEGDFLPPEGALMTVFNANDQAQTLNLFGDETWTLHPVLASSTDPVVKTAKHDANGFYVPGRTTAVFRRAAQSGCAPFANDLYLRGTFYDWGDPAPETYRMQLVSSTSYALTAPVPAGEQFFKISTRSWGGAPDCGAVVDGQTVELGKPSLMACTGKPPNLRMPASTTAGNYVFELDATDNVNPTLTVSKAAPFAVDLYIRGEMNGWANPPPASAKMTHDGTGKYRLVLSGLNAASYNFKVADADWGGSNAGASNCGAPAGGTSVTLGQPFTMLCPSNDNMSVTLPAAGSYVFTADFGNPASPTLTVTSTAFDYGVFVRGSFNGWANPPPANTQMFELGGGLLTRTLLLPLGATNFKVADATWNSFNCGGGTATPGTPVTLSCGSSSPNTVFEAAVAGYYSFTLDANNKQAPTVTVRGP